MADEGTGATIAFGTSTFSADITSINHDDISRVIHDYSHLGTTGNRRKKPGDLVDQSGVTVGMQFDTNKRPPISSAPETITISIPNDDFANMATLAGRASSTIGPLEMSRRAR
ncbi:MAG: hypothetical protein U5L11_02485 [Arhodomonas sp.]|nr:hypothetical protein [Arhodomonas sp.]